MTVLRIKLKSSCHKIIIPSVYCWMNNFTQSLLINELTLGWTKVYQGMLEGIVFDLVLFDIFINDLDEAMVMMCLAYLCVL